MNGIGKRVVALLIAISGTTTVAGNERSLQPVSFEPPEPRSEVRARYTSVSALYQAALEDEGGPADTSCLSSCCDSCPTCPCGQSWVRGEYLLWWTKGAYVPPLLTTSPPGTSVVQAGVLGNPGTTILFGDGDLANGSRSGLRLTAGHWLDDCQQFGLEADYFFLSSESDGYSQDSGGDPILARPFTNAQTGLQDSLLIAYPGLVQGGINVEMTSQEYHSAGLWFRYNVYLERCGCQCCRVDLTGGYRFARLNDGLLIEETEISTALGGLIPQGTRIDLFDKFDTENEFHGGEFGLNASAYDGRWSLETVARVALGNNRQSVDIDGGTTVAVPGVDPVSSAGGFYALGTNSGFHQRDEFVILPEFRVNLGYQINCNWRALAGYTLVYWSDVVRPGDQIDTTINTTQLPPNTLVGVPRPSFDFRATDFWAQGLNFGLEYRR